VAANVRHRYDKSISDAQAQGQSAGESGGLDEPALSAALFREALSDVIDGPRRSRRTSSRCIGDISGNS
jgi:hypothetical protein